VSKTVKNEKLLEFANYIKNRELREIVIEILKEKLETIKTMPASISGKYHLGETVEQHLIRTMAFAALFVQEFNLNQKDTDVLYASALLHDIANCYYTTKEYGVYHREKEATDYHPILGMFILGKKMIERNQLNPLIIETALAISTHMSHWYNKNPLPRTDIEKFLAMSDYLASRKEIKLEPV
jgi:response regulator RpfG family c-di-GMP phosphodiesterase